MPCSINALQTGAVPSGRSVINSSPRSLNVYVSFSITSVEVPTARENTSWYSNIGVSIFSYP